MSDDLSNRLKHHADDWRCGDGRDLSQAEPYIDDLLQRIEELEADITKSRADAETLVKRSKWDYPKPDSAIRQVVDEQANDEGLWCETKYASEAYLQQALRKLHEVIEGKSAEDCAKAVLAKPDSRYVLIRREIAIECVSQLWSNENTGFREELKLALEE